MTVSGIARIAVVKQCGHLMFHFATTLLSNGNPTPSCCHNSKTNSMQYHNLGNNDKLKNKQPPLKKTVQT